MTWRFDGADVSHYQDEAGALINFDELRTAGSWFATKATQRDNYVDPTMARHRSEAHRVGFRHVGLYHWLSPTTEATIERQVARYWKTIGGLSRGEFAMLDAEQVGITEQSAWEWLVTLEDLTHRPTAVYTGVYVAGGNIWRSDRIRNSNYGPRPMHLAAYMTQERLAALLIKLGIQHLSIDANHFGSSGILPTGGTVPGVTGRCDMNQINDIPKFDKAAGITAQPIGEDMDSYVTNAEAREFQGATYPAGNIKYLLMSDGRPRRVTGTELRARGVDTSDLTKFGVPLTNAEFDELGGDWTPTPGNGGNAPTHLDLDIPSVPGRATGTLH